jgi:hypothetical protein
VRIIAVNSAGMSIPSVPLAKPVSFIYLPPLAPTVASVVAGNLSATVTFAGLPARGAPVTGYCYTLDVSANPIVTYDVSGVSPFTITELQQNTQYNISVAAKTPAGNSAWSIPKPLIFVYRAPEKPVINTVTAGSKLLTVVFTVPAANGSPITGYKYTLNGGDKVAVAALVGTNSFVITGLTAGTAFNVQMCATNILGDSDLSLAKPGTPKA